MPLSPRSSANEDDADDRRRSGRVSRKPIHFAPERAKTAGKRKRAQQGNNDDDDGADDDDDIEDDSADESPEDNEDDDADDADVTGPVPKKKDSGHPKKPAAKRPRTNGTTAATNNRSTAPRLPRKKARNINRADAAAAGGLYAQVFRQGGTIENAIADWLRRFGHNENKALADVINFALRCAGCDLEINDHDIADPDACTARLGDLQDEFQAQNVTEYPLIAKSKGTSEFKTSLTHFFRDLVRAIHDNDILLPRVELIENLQRWLTCMTAAQNRPFRHTATVISIAIASALCEIGRDLRAAAASALRHSESEKKAKRVNKDRVNAIRQEATAAAEKQELCDAIVNDWFTTVFIHRYRDIDPRIRVDCATGLGDWILTYPDVFLDDGHLRYLGWLLSDSQATVRHEVVRQLCRLYNDPGRLALLKTFTERFRNRFVEMATSDSEAGVRTEAIKILDTLRAAGYLEPDSIDIVGRLVYDAEPRVRVAVATFFAESVNDAFESKIDDLGGRQAVDEELPESTAPESLNLDWLLIKCLAEMLHAYNDSDGETSRSLMRQAFGGSDLGLHTALSTSRFVIAAEALKSELAVIEDYETISGYLLYDASKNGEDGAAEGIVAQLKEEIKLTADEEVILAELLYMSVSNKLHSLSEDDSNDKHKKKRTKKQREDAQAEKESVQRQLATLLPKLLRRFEDIPQISLIVLRLDREAFGPDYEPDASVYTTFINDVKNQFLTHSDEMVIDEACSALLRAKDNDETSELAEEKIDELWEELTGQLIAMSDCDLTVRGNLPNDTAFALAKTVFRIRRLATISQAVEHLTSVKAGQAKSPLDCLIDCIGRGVEQAGSNMHKDAAQSDDDLALHASGAVSFYFLWATADMITKLSAPSGRISGDRLIEAARARDDFMNSVVELLEARKPTEAISIGIAGHILDMHATFSTLRRIEVGKDQDTEFLVLALEIDVQPAELILGVFSACEQRYAKLWNRTIEKEVTKKKRGTRARAQRADDADPIDEDEHEDDPTQDPQASDDEASDAESVDGDLNADPDDGDEDDLDEATLAARKQARLTAARLLSEQRLCELAAKMVLCLLAGMFPDARRVRKRLDLNKTKLGANYRQVLKLLEQHTPTTARNSKAARATPARPVASRKAVQSAELITESDEDEDEDNDGADAVSDVDGAEEQDQEEDDVDSQAEEEIESVIGD